MKIKCLILTALLMTVASVGFAQSKAKVVAPNVIVKNLYASQKVGLGPFFSQTGFTKTAAKQTDDERMGSADILSGKVYNISIFISTPDNPWKKQDKLSIYEKQREAQNWLVEQAEEYEVELEFENGTYGLNGDDISVENIPASDKSGKGMNTDWSSYLLKKIGYKTPLSLWDWVEEKTDCTNLQVIVYSNSKGVSYGLPYTPGTDAEKYFVELALVHRYYPSGSELSSSTIAHESLHLYGAWDLYNTYKHDKDVATKSKELFPNDVMYRTSFNIGELEINELTAWRIGWNNEEKPSYNWFKPGK